jgi:hypothetical protein
MRIIKKLIIYTTIIGTVLFSILVVFGFIYQDEVVEAVKSELNKSLNAEINVQTIDLSFISHFPSATVNLKYVAGFESKEYSKTPDTLFVFEDFSLSFNVIEIFKGNYVLNEIQAEKGFLNLKFSKNGVPNYAIFKTDTSQEETSFKVDLNRVHLLDCKVGYRDYSTSDRYKFLFPNLIAKGSFSDTEVHTALYGSTQVLDLVLDEISYLKNEKVKLDVGVGINLESGIFQISRGYLTLRDNYVFDVKGKTGKDSFKYVFEAKNLDLNQAESLIPKKHKKFINTYEFDGVADVLLKIERNGGGNPDVSGKFSWTKGQFKNIETNVSIGVPKAVGTFDLGVSAGPRTAKIELSQFEIVTNEGVVAGVLAIENLRHPKFKLEAEGKVDLFQFSKLINLGEKFGMSGSANFKAKVTGSIKQIDSIVAADIKTIRGNASINLANTQINIQDLPQIDGVDLQMDLNHQVVNINSFEGNVAGSKTQAILQVTNWLDFILNQKELIRLNGNVTTDRFDLADWKRNTENNKSSISMPNNIAYSGNVKVNVFKSDRIEFKNLKTEVEYYPKQLQLSETYFDGFGGKLFLNFKMKEGTKSIFFSGDIKTQDVDVDSMMETFNDFGQKTLTHEHFKGKLNSSMRFSFKSNKDLDIYKPSIFVDGDLFLLKGELIEYKLLYDIPKDIESNKIIALFVNLDAFEKRLHHIKFDTISNHITIKNETITIPRMDIHSSAMSISLQGVHTFSNEMDYYMNFNLKEVLSKKKRITTEYGYIKDDNLGNRMVYLHVYTKNGEVEVDLDKNGAKKHNQTKVNEELNDAKSILKEELGLFKNDTSVVVKDEAPIFEYDIDLGEFSDTLEAITGDTLLKDSDTTMLKKDSSLINKILKKKKKKKKEKEDFEEWDFDDDDY